MSWASSSLREQDRKLCTLLLSTLFLDFADNFDDIEDGVEGMKAGVLKLVQSCAQNDKCRELVHSAVAKRSILLKVNYTGRQWTEFDPFICVCRCYPCMLC